ncbi:hypothetical protein [Actinomadura luteofluorescens]|uniref:hypothetical protein n=1 Tax=Actinomadura luteofluorescens TaxID=46163 RepID=UPI00216481FC|nr:hypothetical protein [Actinomadura glauciflava]
MVVDDGVVDEATADASFHAVGWAEATAVAGAPAPWWGRRSYIWPSSPSARWRSGIPIGDMVATLEIRNGYVERTARDELEWMMREMHQDAVTPERAERPHARALLDTGRYRTFEWFWKVT